MRYFFIKDEKRRVKILFASLFILVLFVGALMIIPTSADAKIYDNVVRFHVIANSDSDEDQSLKLKVRDAVIEEYKDFLALYFDKEALVNALNSKTEEINSFAEKIIKEHGYSYSCKVTLGTEHYGRTVYESFSMPKGNYTSLRIIIGKGEGKNWWCVLFPLLCTKAAINECSIEDEKDEFTEVGFTAEQYNIITKNESPRYKLKFRLLELFFGT